MTCYRSAMRAGCWLVPLAFAVACGGSSDGGGGVGGASGGTAGVAGSASGGTAGAAGSASGGTAGVAGVAGSASGGTAGVAGVAGSAAAVGWQECFGADGQNVQWVLSQCTGNTCEMMHHVLDCCGNTMLVGVEASKKALFEACEAAWAATLPACGCPSGPLQIQQPFGSTVTDASEANVGCINWTSSGGVCMTTKK
jgi:hypothetical protein